MLERLRKRAAAEDKSMGRLASEVLASGPHEQAHELPPLRWPSRGTGLEVDLEDKEALWRFLDEEWYENGTS